MAVRLNKVIKEFNVGLQTVVDFLAKKGHTVEAAPNSKLSDEQYELVQKEFRSDESARNEATRFLQERIQQKQEQKQEKDKKQPQEVIRATVPEDMKPKLEVVGKVELEAPKKEEKPVEAPAEQPAKKEAKPEAEKADEKPEVKTEEPKAEADESQEVVEMVETTEKPEPQKTGETTEAQTEAPAEKPAKKAKSAKPTVEERAKQIGSVNEGGVFELKNKPEIEAPKVVGKIDLSTINTNMRPKKKTKEERRKEAAKQQAAAGEGKKKKRNRIGDGQRVDINDAVRQQQGGPADANKKKGGNAAAQQQSGNGKKKNKKAKDVKVEISEEDVAKQVRETLARLTSKSKTAKGAKYRKEKREQVRAAEEEQRREQNAESQVLKLTEFVTANELATMMDVPVTKVIATCMSIGIMVSINQRLDAETINIVAEEFGFKTEYVSAEVQDAVAETEDKEEDLEPRAPIVTVMGHVDHGKTSLLDYIRKSNVIAGEAGGITQHIGAYNVTLENGRHITFLDTPGHEAFTAMRARGAQVTDIAIIIIAADDDIMPQTKEAINHAQAAGVPIVFAINKIDKPAANPEKIKEALANMNLLVEEWGGKYQSQDISAKKGMGVPELLEKVLLEADLMELKANPNRKATGTVIESALDKGRGYVASACFQWYAPSGRRNPGRHELWPRARTLQRAWTAHSGDRSLDGRYAAGLQWCSAGRRPVPRDGFRAGGARDLHKTRAAAARTEPSHAEDVNARRDWPPHQAGQLPGDEHHRQGRRGRLRRSSL